jgi:hypothetical protein
MRGFSLKRLFAGVTLVAVGLMIVVGLADYEFDVPPTALDIAAALAWAGGGMIVGAGALLPFRRVRLGMSLGFLMMLLFLAAAYYQVAY